MPERLAFLKNAEAALRADLDVWRQACSSWELVLESARKGVDQQKIAATETQLRTCLSKISTGEARLAELQQRISAAGNPPAER